MLTEMEIKFTEKFWSR